MHCNFTQSSWNHLISNLSAGASHHLLMPLTYCRMRVNVNEKYIIHIPTMPSKSAARCASQDASTLRAERQRKTKHAYTIYYQPYWFSLFFFFWVGWGCLQLYCTPESVFSAPKRSYGLRVNSLTKGSQCFPTFSSLKRLHLNNNEGEMTTAKESNLKNISVEKPVGGGIKNQKHYLFLPSQYDLWLSWRITCNDSACWSSGRATARDPEILQRNRE